RHSLLRPGEGIGGSACLPVELCDLKERPRRRKVAACYGHLGFYVTGFARQRLHDAGDGATLSRPSRPSRWVPWPERGDLRPLLFGQPAVRGQALLAQDSGVGLGSAGEAVVRALFE